MGEFFVISWKFVNYLSFSEKKKRRKLIVDEISSDLLNKKDMELNFRAKEMKGG